MDTWTDKDADRWTDRCTQTHSDRQTHPCVHTAADTDTWTGTLTQSHVCTHRCTDGHIETHSVCRRGWTETQTDTLSHTLPGIYAPQTRILTQQHAHSYQSHTHPSHMARAHSHSHTQSQSPTQSHVCTQSPQEPYTATAMHCCTHPHTQLQPQLHCSEHSHTSLHIQLHTQSHTLLLHSCTNNTVTDTYPSSLHTHTLPEFFPLFKFRPLLGRLLCLNGFLNLLCCFLCWNSCPTLCWVGTLRLFWCDWHPHQLSLISVLFRPTRGSVPAAGAPSATSSPSAAPSSVLASGKLCLSQLFQEDSEPGSAVQALGAEGKAPDCKVLQGALSNSWLRAKQRNKSATIKH